MNESDIHVIYGSRDIASMAYELMDAMDVAAELQKDTQNRKQKGLKYDIVKVISGKQKSNFTDR